MRFIFAVLLSALLAPVAHASGTPGQFDYYVMALSWSPDYCAVRPDDREQCSRQYGFVLHGLWPQYQRGYPADCSPERFDEGMLQQFSGLYPSRTLYRHEWEKHGTCSGLSQPQYHQLAASLKARLTIPAAYQAPVQPLRKTLTELKAELQAANPWLGAESRIASGQPLARRTGAGGIVQRRRALPERNLCVYRQAGPSGPGVWGRCTGQRAP